MYDAIAWAIEEKSEIKMKLKQSVGFSMNAIKRHMLWLNEQNLGRRAQIYNGNQI